MGTRRCSPAGPRSAERSPLPRMCAASPERSVSGGKPMHSSRKSMTLPAGYCPSLDRVASAARGPRRAPMLPPRARISWLFLLAVGLACHSAKSQASAPPARLPRAQAHVPRERHCDVLHYAVALELFPEEKRIEAACRVRFTPLAEPVRAPELDLVGLAVDGIRDERGRALTFERERGALTIALA